MALELWVHGPRYGESILMTWQEAGTAAGQTVNKAALIDCHGVHEPIGHGLTPDSGVLAPLEKLPEPWSLAFVAGTHPHLDHVASLAEVLADLGEDKARVESTIWWGGHFSDTLEFHRARSAHHRKTGQKNRAKASVAAVEFLLMAQRLQTYQGKQMVPHSRIVKLYHRNLPNHEGTIRVWGISPCETERDAYHAAMRKQNPEAAKLTPVESNRASLGFLIQYKDAQIILGGDMEAANWQHFNAVRDEQHGDDHDLPPLSPHVIKVSHHGSPTGLIPGMWVPGSGFFNTAPGDKPKPVCIVTPWKRKLPDKLVINQMLSAGCRVVVTGLGVKPHLATDRLSERKNRKVISYCHLRIHPDGAVEDVELVGCAEPPASKAARGK